MGMQLAKTPQELSWWIITNRTNQTIINPWDLRNGKPFIPQHQFDGYPEMLNYFPDSSYPVMDYSAMFQIMQKPAYEGWLKMYGGDFIDSLSSVRIDDLRTWLNIRLQTDTPLQVKLPDKPREEPVYLYYHTKHGGYLAYRIFYQPGDYNWLINTLSYGRLSPDDQKLEEIKSFPEKLAEKGIYITGQPNIDPETPYQVSFKVTINQDKI